MSYASLCNFWNWPAEGMIAIEYTRYIFGRWLPKSTLSPKTKRIAIGSIDELDEKFWDSNMKYVMQDILNTREIEFVSFEAHTHLYHIATHRTFFPQTVP